MYQPGEDSFLLLEWLKKQELKEEKLLDMGTGTGILALEAAERGATVTAADIDPEAVETVKDAAEEQGLEVETVETDLFEKIESRFDLIVFNPPYLPGKEIDEEDRTWRGGEEGIELTERFLREAENYLEKNGRIVFVASSRADLNRLREEFELETVDSTELWFETLYLLKRD